jgi:hypothetical protein
MNARQLRAGSLVSGGLFALALIAGSNWSALISESPLLTNAILVIATASILGCAFFGPDQ